MRPTDRDFSAELSHIFDKHRDPDVREAVPRYGPSGTFDKYNEPDVPEVSLRYDTSGDDGIYDIYKRSLPAGTNKIVGIGFTKIEAINAIETIFKARFVDDVWYYYDPVERSNEAAKNPLWNPKGVVQ